MSGVIVLILSLYAGSNAKYVSGAVFGGGLLLCTCIGIFVFWLYVRRRRQSSGRRMNSTARRRRCRSITGQTAQTERRISASAASGRRLFVAPQPSPLADPNAPPPYAPSAGSPSSDPPPYTAQTAANSLQPFPQALEVPRPLSYSDEPPAYLSPPAYDPECDNHQWQRQNSMQMKSLLYFYFAPHCVKHFIRNCVHLCINIDFMLLAPAKCVIPLVWSV